MWIEYEKKIQTLCCTVSPGHGSALASKSTILGSLSSFFTENKTREIQDYAPKSVVVLVLSRFFPTMKQNTAKTETARTWPVTWGHGLVLFLLCLADCFCCFDIMILVLLGFPQHRPYNHKHAHGDLGEGVTSKRSFTFGFPLIRSLA